MKIGLPLLLFFLGSYFNANSQGIEHQKFNLNLDSYDEEKKNSTGWGKWGRFEHAKAELLPDGNYVGKVVSDKKGPFGCIVYRIPANYEGDSVKLSGFIKTEQVKKGYAGLIMRIDGVNRGSFVLDNSRGKGVSGSSEWQEYSITLPLIKNARNIFVGGILSGKGTAWFDDFTLTIDGKDVQQLQEIEKPVLKASTSEELLADFKTAKRELIFDTDNTLSISLDALIETIGDKRIVAIGEDTHGTSEFYRLREVITKKLILEKGFTTVVLESPYDEIELLTENLEKKEVEQLMKDHLLSIYQTKEMKSFIDWFKTKTISKKVNFKGSDDSYWSVHHILNKELSQNEDTTLRDLNEDFQNLIKAYSRAKMKKVVNAGAKVYHAIVSLENYLDKKELHTDHSRELLFNAKSSYVNYVNLAQRKAVQSRDEIMADRISFLAQNSNEKIIVWAHNAHISNDIIIDNEIGLMGHDLKKEFGDMYYSIGLSSFEGSYSYIENKFINDDNSFDDSLKQEQLVLRPTPSWEQLFAKVNSANYYLVCDELENQAHKKKVLGDLKLVGYAKESKKDYYHLSPFAMFDALLFIKRTNATTPLNLTK